MHQRNPAWGGTGIRFSGVAAVHFLVFCYLFSAGKTRADEGVLLTFDHILVLTDGSFSCINSSRERDSNGFDIPDREFTTPQVNISLDAIVATRGCDPEVTLPQVTGNLQFNLNTGAGTISTAPFNISGTGFLIDPESIRTTLAAQGSVTAGPLPRELSFSFEADFAGCEETIEPPLPGPSQTVPLQESVECESSNVRDFLSPGEEFKVTQPLRFRLHYETTRLRIFVTFIVVYRIGEEVEDALTLNVTDPPRFGFVERGTTQTFTGTLTHDLRTYEHANLALWIEKHEGGIPTAGLHLVEHVIRDWSHRCSHDHRLAGTSR